MVITVLAVIGKFLGCYFASLGMGKRSATIVGIGMVPRGEVGIIVAVVGLSLSAIPNSMFSVVVFMSIATTIIVPPLLVWSFKRPDRPESANIDSHRKTARERRSLPPVRKSVRELVSTKARRPK